ncbi:polysaccharide biosynthesis C-terminal domain-containing protein [Streptomyces sp. NPDC059850]|uniref:polysaccharide biosynthesis C-terminal domain-containing protein n=1 Tax=Streptomyces sp. NPDC059850 TaxID=3346970 RepID=UPI003645FC3B
MSDTTTRTEAAGAAEAAGATGAAEQPPTTGGGSQLFRNAYALMLNTGISAVLGLGFWLVAARYYADDAVGQGSAAIAAMKLLAGLTAVTLTGALARFIPVAGRTTGRLVGVTYAGSSVVVACAAVVFLLTLDLWGPSYRFLQGPVHGVGFVVAVVGWSLLTLQDGVLTGLRSALWVPVGNTVFLAAKLLLLFALASTIPTAGVFVSWVISIALSVLPLGWLVFRRLVPRHAKTTKDRARPASYREMGRFLAGDYTGSLFSLAVVYAVPVIVASQVGSADNAYFYIATTIGGTVNLLAINMGASLTVEGAHDPARLAENCRAALRRMARIMVPVCLGLFVFAPRILGVFGAGYADAAAPLLRWFAVGAALRVVIEVYFAVLRAQSRTSGLAYLQGLLCVLVLGLTLLLLPRMGLVGAGIAEISSLAVIASIASVKLYRVVKAQPTAPAPAPAPARIPPPPGPTPVWERGTAPDGDLADLAVDGDRRARRSRGTHDPRYGTRWALRAALDADTLVLGVRMDFDHPERRPDARYGPQPEAPPTTPLPTPPPTEKPVPSMPMPDTTTAAPPPRDTRTPRPQAVTAVLWAALAAGLVLYWLPLFGLDDADLDRMGGLGLVSVLPVPTLVGAALLVAVFAGALGLGRQRRALLAVTLLATVVSLHAVPGVLETHPRFPTAWQHLGFLDYIGRTGDAVPDLDARWSWPGFFAGAAFLAEACGVRDFSALLRWWPTLIQLLYLAPLMVLMRALRASWRAKWTAVWLFGLSGWVGQDYFSPQGFTYLFYLVFVAVLLVWFREPRVLGAKRRPGEAEVAEATRGQRAALLGLLITLFAASVAAHQLTPFVMLGVVTALVLVRRSDLYGLPLLCGVMVVVWIGFLAEPYWSGHWDELFGGVGGVGGNVSSSVSGRIEGGSSVHKLVLYVRVALAGGVLAFACWGVLRRRAAGFTERALLVLTFVPFLGFGMQSYGGEMALRVFMFALPGACVLGALAIFPRVRPDRRGLAPLAALVAGLTLMSGFLVARWGNEAFERVRPGEVAAMEYLYAHDKPTARVLWMSDDPVNSVTPAMPWGARDMERVAYEPTLAPRDPVLVGGLVTALRDAGPRSYLMVGRGQSISLQMDSGYGARWQERLLRSLDHRPDLRRVLSNEDASLYELKRPPRGAVPEPTPGPAGPQITWTPWSVTGALAAVVLMVLLAAREVVRVAVRPSVRRLRLLQASYWFALPLLVVVLASLAQRFLTMV